MMESGRDPFEQQPPFGNEAWHGLSDASRNEPQSEITPPASADAFQYTEDVPDGGSSTHIELYEVIVPDEVPSRGTGELVSFAEMCAYDIMPPHLGVQFMLEPELQKYVYFSGENMGGQIRLSFMDMQGACEEAAETSLNGGNIQHALIAYNAAVQNAAAFARAVHGVQSIALLSKAELERLGSEQFATLEEKISRRLGEPLPVLVDDYRSFVRGVASDERTAVSLYQTVAAGFDSYDRPVNGGPDPQVARECMELYEKMCRFDAASAVAEKMGWQDAADAYKERRREGPHNTHAMRRAIRSLEQERIEWEIKHSW